jgi:hypothetical protein
MSKYNLTDIFEEMSTAEKERFDRLSKDDQDKLKKVMGIMAKEKSMKEDKYDDIKEVTSSEISRMEGLVDQRMKAKLLDIFGDLYFDLTDEDPFQAEDVVDYLGNEMLKHLDNIQAQGDRLNNTDADFEREQRMQMDMREEDEINEELAPTGIAVSQKQLDDLKKLGAISGLEVTVQDKDGSNVRKVDYTLTNTDFEKDPDDIDFVNEDLKNHFGRFMKDYQ